MNTNGGISNKKNTRIDLNSKSIIINIQNINNKSDLNNNIINVKNNLTDNTTIKYDFINKYNDYEMNNLKYEYALKYDKRTYVQYYFSLLKYKHLIMFTFYTKNDYNSRIIKIIIFLFSFALYFAVNALFFNDSTMHQIYEDQGNFNFIYQLPQIFYSTIINASIILIVNYLSLTEKNILALKNEKDNINEKKSKLLNYLKLKFILFFILLFSFLILFCYYLSCFCAVYKKTQIHLLKDTLISFGLSLIYPFILNLIPGIFRLISLKSKNKKCMYKFSKIIQLL